MASKLETALMYASWGWHVLPILENSKLPATAHGVHDATTNEETIRRWWGHNADYNVAIAAGQKSGIQVFDIDPRNGGVESWEHWLDENSGDCVEDCAMQLTAGGGFHVVAHYNPDIKSMKLDAGIDLLSDGRYFLAYPSVIDGNHYDWEADSDPADGVGPFRIPEQWAQAIKEKSAGRGASLNVDVDIIQGNRNDALTAMAGALRHHGLTEAEILAALQVANESRCSPPMPASEIAHIARSVARYEPEYDIAASVAVGAAAAANLIKNENNRLDYHLTSGSSLISQPAPIPWILKGWIPENTTGVIYGKPASGKTFVAIDLALSIATSKNWHDVKTKAPGDVVYLAGEGNYGLRRRLASWAKHHDIYDLSRFFVSNKPIDLDAAGASTQIISAIKEVTDNAISLIVIDTLNRHMAGEENSSTDMRKLLNSAALVAAQTQATVVFIHHTGHGDGAAGRERGSSALRGAMDFSIYVNKSDDDTIKVNCVKQKDAPTPKKLSFKLEEIDLGWQNDDGESINGALVLPCVQDDSEAEESEIDIVKRVLSEAWFTSGCEIKSSGYPYIEKTLLRDLLYKEFPEKSKRTIQNQVGYSSTEKQKYWISELENEGYILRKNLGFEIIDPAKSSALKLQKKTPLQPKNQSP